LSPSLEVEVAWRFDSRAKGIGLEVINGGSVVRRIDEDEVVVLGDAPLVVCEGRAPYIEVCIEAMDDGPCGDGINDFGIGWTATDPENLKQLGLVAAEVPSSWVVDFTTSMVCLSINNSEEARGHGASSCGLYVGDRVGVRATPEDSAVEVYVNGHLCARLPTRPGKEVPQGARLFPVLDLYGRVSQLSRSYAEVPAP